MSVAQIGPGSIAQVYDVDFTETVRRTARITVAAASVQEAVALAWAQWVPGCHGEVEETFCPLQVHTRLHRTSTLTEGATDASA